MKLRIFLLLSVVFIFNSCLGLSMDISMKRDGSGRITMEYQIPAVIQNLGRLDGNQNWPTVPVGRADFERSIARIDGVRLVSFSSHEKDQQISVKAVLDFNNMDTLVKLLGKNASYNSGNLNIVLFDPGDININPDLLELLKQSAKDKKISVNFKADGKPPYSFSIPTAELFDSKDSLVLNINY